MNVKKTILIIFAAAVCLRAAIALSSVADVRAFFSRVYSEANPAAVFRSFRTGKADAEKTKEAKDGGKEREETDADSQSALPPFPADWDTPLTGTKAAKGNDGKGSTADKPVILPTTIEGGMVVKNDTNYELDIGPLVAAGSNIALSRSGPQILIVHTHGSEAYTPDETYSYSPSDNFRTEDRSYSVIRVGDELASCLESYGLNVVHDRNIYDYPSYTGSYAKSGDAIGKYLKEYPGISVVLDIHRDSIGSGDTVYKTVAEAGGEPCSQVMLLVGTGENGLPDPNWKENLKFALYLQSAAVNKYPTLQRPIALEKERYNQQLSTGALIVEVGSSGNTLTEALNAVRLFADAIAPALKDKVKEGA